MEEREIEIREQICEVGYDLWLRGFVAANDGNISVKIDDNVFITTPSGISKKKLKPEMLVKMRGNEIIDCPSGLKPSSEFKMHLSCYRARPEINAVVHAHPPTATGYAAAHVPLDDFSVSEAIMFLGAVPVAPYATPGSDGVGKNAVPFLETNDAVLLANHGALTVGVDLTQAYYRMETLEHFAKVSLIAKLLGGAKELSREEIDKCSALSKNYPIRNSGYKKYSE